MLAVYKELLDDREFVYQFEKEYKKQRARKNEVILYYLKQKLCGFLFVVISILLPLMDGDATVSVLILPLGVYLLFTKEKIMYIKKSKK